MTLPAESGRALARSPLIVVLVVVAVVLYVGLWFVLKPSALMPSSAEQPQQHIRYNLTIGQAGVMGPRVMTVQQGTWVDISLVSDRADELHLHGYGKVIDLHPGEMATLRFKAGVSGRFELESHRSHQLVSVLEVYPSP